MHASKSFAFLLVLILASTSVAAFVPIYPSQTTKLVVQKKQQALVAPAQAASDDNQEGWDDDVDYDALEQEASGTKNESPDPNTEWNEDTGEPKLGINIGQQLKPLTPDQAADLKAEATEIINDAFAEGIDDIERLRKDMEKQVEKSKRAMQTASDYNAQRESARLLGKIDRMTNKFLDDTKDSRLSTKLASAADRASEGKGVDMGSWGVLGGAVVTTDGGSASSLLGSVDAAKSPTKVFEAEGLDEEAVEPSAAESRVLIVADESSDPIAKQVMPKFVDLLKDAIPGVVVQTIKPTATMPMGGDDAQCLIVFGTSLSDRSGLQNILSRVLRRTLQPGGKMGSPPTQIVCVSSIGTERTDKFPYSMQNLMGGKLEKKRQIEESVITAVKNRVITPPLDYTILKLGEIKDSSDSFQMMPGDVLDGTTSATVAAEVLLQAVAYQPSARNATLCAVGGNVPSEWEDLFVRLDGPELQRFENLSGPKEQLVEYLKEWAELMPDYKRLTTPVRVEVSTQPPNAYEKVSERAGVSLLYMPTNTGKAYLSKEEERVREQQTGSSSSGGAKNNLQMKKMKKEGGVEVLTEVTSDGELRVRARRCNMGDDTVVKEISEETILKRLEEAIKVWKQDHPTD